MLDILTRVSEGKATIAEINELENYVTMLRTAVYADWEGLLLILY
jgi:hypothetical protein